MLFNVVCRSLVSAVALGLVLVAPAYAISGAELYGLCTDPPKSGLGDVSCEAYVRGFIDGFVVATSVADNGRKICIPDGGISVIQGRLILEKALRDYPEFLHEEGGYIFGFAMEEAFHVFLRRAPENEEGTAPTR